MAQQITWSRDADAAILHLRAAGTPWPRVAAHLQVGRNAVIERARRLGLRPAAQPTRQATQAPRIDRPALQAGHPLSWDAITHGTTLHGMAYPLPVFL